MPRPKEADFEGYRVSHSVPLEPVGETFAETDDREWFDFEQGHLARQHLKADMNEAATAENSEPFMRWPVGSHSTLDEENYHSKIYDSFFHPEITPPKDDNIYDHGLLAGDIPFDLKAEEDAFYSQF